MKNNGFLCGISPHLGKLLLLPPVFGESDADASIQNGLAVLAAYAFMKTIYGYQLFIFI